MRLADGKKFDDKGFSGFDFDGDFFAGLQAIEKRGRGQNADVGIGLSKLVVFGEDVGIKQIAEQVVATEGMTEFFLERVFLFLEFHWFQVCAWAATKRSMAAQDNFLQLLWPAAGRHAEDAGKQFADGIWERDVVFFVERENVRRLHLLGHQEKRHVADNFAGRRDFNDVAEKLVYICIHLFDFAPTMAQ